MAGVAITLVSINQAGGSGSDTVTTAEYANADAAVAAISGGWLAVNSPTNGGGARQINVTRISQIVST